MKKSFSSLYFLLLFCPTVICAQKAKVYEVKSPDGTIVLKVESGAKLLWSVQHKGQQLISPSAISLLLQSGEILGDNANVTTSRTASVNTSFNAVNYRKTEVSDVYNQLTLSCKSDYGVIFRVFNDAVAYRYFTKRKEEIVIKNEEANFNFTEDHKAFIPYLRDYRDGKIFNASFESLYTEHKISEFFSDSLAFLPLLVELNNGKKILLIEADLEEYPGMFLVLNETKKGFKGIYAPYPLETKMAGYNNINLIPTKRADYIAKTTGTRSFPWRAIIISEQDKDLLNCDIVQKLASPSRIEDISWIKPGQVAWDWWNNMNISGVDFRAGKNTSTYKYFIDFVDRDDQLAVATTYEIAKLAAENHLLVDYHGVFKPTGLQRTYPTIQMLSDNPTIYMREYECTEFITKIPTTFDETVPLDSKVAEYVAIARRKGETWFVGAMTNWTPRELTIDFSFLKPGKYQTEIFSDGINADRDATDYKKEVVNISAGDKLNVKLMNGGGWAARIEKK